MSSGPKDQHDQHAPREHERGDGVARRLTGKLICISCGYDLKGLSIRTACPECGVPVRATLLDAVDPRAEELEPLGAPFLVAHGLVLWSLGALTACLCVWGLRIDEILRNIFDLSLGLRWLGILGTLGVAASGIGALVIIRPHRRVTRLNALRAAIGVAMYIPLTYVYWTIYRSIDMTSGTPIVNPSGQDIERSLLRLSTAVLVTLIILGLRPNAVSLAMRSVIVRTGRVDRQSMYALLASVLLAAIGDVINTIGVLNPGVLGDLLVQFHIVFVAIGSVLITLGLFNVFLDTLRLRPVLWRSGVGLGDVFETNRERDTRVSDDP